MEKRAVLFLIHLKSVIGGTWHLLTFICIMRVGRNKNIFFLFRSPEAFQLLPTQTNAWHKARNFIFPEAQNKQQLEGIWLSFPFSWHPMLTPSSHSQACVLVLGEKDVVASAGAAAAGKTNNIPLWTADVCFPHLPWASYFENVGVGCSFLPILCQMLQYPWDRNILPTCKMMCYL